MIAVSRQLTDTDKALLSSIRGKTITTIRIIRGHNLSSPYGLVVIDFKDAESIQLINEEKPVKFFDNKDEEVVGFRCDKGSSISSDLEFDNYSLSESEIQSVEVITDKISFKTDDYGDYEITLDAGIIFHGEKHSYVFTLDTGFFFERILYSTDGNINQMRPVEEIRKAWCKDTEKYKDFSLDRTSSLL